MIMNPLDELRAISPEGLKLYTLRGRGVPTSERRRSSDYRHYSESSCTRVIYRYPNLDRRQVVDRMVEILQHMEEDCSHGITFQEFRSFCDMSVRSFFVLLPFDDALCSRVLCGRPSHQASLTQQSIFSPLWRKLCTIE